MIVSGVQGTPRSTGTENAALHCEARGFDAILFKAHQVELFHRKERAGITNHDQATEVEIPTLANFDCPLSSSAPTSKCVYVRVLSGTGNDQLRHYTRVSPHHVTLISGFRQGRQWL